MKNSVLRITCNENVRRQVKAARKKCRQTKSKYSSFSKHLSLGKIKGSGVWIIFRMTSLSRGYIFSINTGRHHTRLIDFKHLKSLLNLVSGEIFSPLGIVYMEKLSFKNCNIIWRKPLRSSYILCKILTFLNPRRAKNVSGQEPS